MAYYNTTERLKIRTAKESDAPYLAEIRNTPFVRRYNMYGISTSEDIVEELSYREHIVLERIEDNKILGCIYIDDDYFRYHIDCKELHFWLSPESANKGYMSEAIPRIIEYLFIEKNAEYISIKVFSENKASLALAKKLGFEREGYLKRAVRRNDDEIFDLVLFSMDAACYQKKH